MVCTSGGSGSTGCVPINIWFGSSIWDDGWIFGTWLSGSAAGVIDSGCCIIDVKNGGVWGIKDYVAVDWKVSGV